ncbi:MAG TPA: hypothetical protein VHY19_07275 [Steroidobacteraceae bacterium]|jgi:hypothetical protein|nr:hypothetical protein [Steroidobacteraceae bacterium]
MRILYDRYGRDIARYNLAACMLKHEARTQTIHQWTGLPADRIRNLYRSYLHEQGAQNGNRHRGPPPQSADFFLKSVAIRVEATALAGVCCALGVIPAEPVADAGREVPSVARGECLCRAFEFYQSTVVASELTLDHAVLLVMALSHGQELQIGRCGQCGIGILIDPLSTSRRICTYCRHESGSQAQERGSTGITECPSYQQGVLI